MSEPVSRVRFPVLLRFSIENYELYPGRDGEGLHAHVQPGVNIIVGINGLGKTTLLNALFRVMSGPSDWSKRHLNRPVGTTSTALGPWKDKTFFSDRVPDRAKHATVEATLDFEGCEVLIRRRLTDLGLVRLEVNGETREPQEDGYQAAVVELSSVESFEDFFALLRYLAFYLEGRQEVVWDPGAQSDLLRILFFPHELSHTIRKQSAEVQRLDSLIRNRIYGMAPVREDLQRLEKKLADEMGTLREREALQARLAGAKRRESALQERSRTVDDAYRKDRLRLEREKVRLVELLSEYELQEQAFFGSLFPDVDATIRRLLMRLTAGGGCLVCGTQTEEATQHVLVPLREGRCPVCGSPPEDQENVVSPGKLAQRRLDKLHGEIRELKEHLSAMSEDVEQLLTERLSIRHELVEARSERDATERELGALNIALPSDHVRLQQLRATLKTLEAAKEQDEKERKRAAAALRGALSEAELRIRKIEKEITAAFSDYINGFFAERCELQLQFETRQLGQRGGGVEPFRFARFVPYLSSGGFEHTLQPRYNPGDVSESQKEFIDLAFRMALLVVAARDRPAMLALETPEASLDAVFIPKAGQLFGKFAASGGRPSNRLIASSNLNQTHMIPAMFGILTDNERRAAEGTLVPVVPREERATRVVDLIDIAKPNAALQKYRAEYTAELLAALYPESLRAIDMAEEQ
jgi:energy-coupling factor transporter ATP-binding protein EcfA2